MIDLVLDIECTRQVNPINGRDDPSPYNSKNRLVYVGYNIIGEDKPKGIFFHHKDYRNDTILEHEILQQILNETKLLIAHNAKFDTAWLLEAGFTLPKDIKFYDTMIHEYICNKGLKSSLRLADLAVKYNLSHKLDILQDYWEKGINTDEVPMAELEEYALQDIITTKELYELQQSKTDADTIFMQPAIQLTNEALPVIVEMERNGCYIDLPTLNDVEQEYVAELSSLDRGIKEMVSELMGDTPININSTDDMCKLLYGIEVKDKKVWAEEFNIGSADRNGVKKRKYPKRMSTSQLDKVIKSQTDKIYKTEAEQCTTCNGHKKIRKIKVTGEPFKNDTVCPNCNGNGFIYLRTTKLAGLRLRPISSQYATAAGFAADKKVIEQYLSRESLDDDVKAFLRALQRQSAITNYLSTFVEGISNNVKEDWLLHCNLNQTVTATARLSSSNPNLQNQPRDNTFPIRKAFASRFKNGKILDADWSGLEFRTAVAISGDKQGLSDIANKADVHQFTADTITKKGQPTTRQEAKPHTFKPLFAGMSGTDAEIAYYQEFNKKYSDIHLWQEKLVQNALEEGQIKSPSSRIYAFNNVYRMLNGNVKGKTQIYNYCIQGFASDLMQTVLIELNKKLKGLKSLLILTVHDSLLIDVHPEEEVLVINIVKEVMGDVKKYLNERFNFNTPVEFDFEIKIGKNWGQLVKI